MAKTLKGRQVSICATPQNEDLTKSEFDGLSWVPVSNCGMLGESGPSTNLPSYDEFDTMVIQKSKGLTDAGNPTLEVSLNLGDTGQNLLRTVADPDDDNAYAISWVDLDGVTHYTRAKISGPTSSNGRVEDFRIQTFTLGAVQLEEIVTAADLVAPVNTLPPAMSAAQTLDISDGTVVTGLFGEWEGHPTSFEWVFEKDAAGNGTFAAISGADGTWTFGEPWPTYTIVGGTGATNRIRFGVKGVNSAGTTADFVYSTPSIPVIA